MGKGRKAKIPVFIWLCYGISFYSGFSSSAMQFVLLDMKTEFGLSSTLMATISSVQMIVTLVMTLLFAGILDKLDPKRAILAGGTLSVAGAVLTGMAPSPWAVLISYVVTGIGTSITGAAVYPAMAKMDPAHITEHVNRQQGMLSLGAFGAPLLMALLITQLSMPWRWTYFINAGIMGAILVGVALVPSPGKTIKAAAKAVAETPEQQKARKRILYSPAFICMGLSLGLYIFMEMGVIFYIKDYFVVELNDMVGASLCISAIRGGTTLIRLVGDRLCKNRVWMSVGSFALSVVGVLLLATLRIPVVALIWCVLFGVLAGPCWPTVMSLGLSLDPNSSGRLSSILSLCTTIGNNLGNVCIGACVDTMGVGNAYYVAAAVGAIGTLVTMAGIREFRKRGIAPEGEPWLEQRAARQAKRA